MILVAVAAGITARLASTDEPAGAVGASPAVAAYLPASTIGWVELDSDPSTAAWRRLRRSLGVAGRSPATRGELLRSTLAPVASAGDLERMLGRDVDGWIGRRLGLAAIDGRLEDPTHVVGWSDVAHPREVERRLRGAGWRRERRRLGGRIAIWTGPGAERDGPAVGLADDALVVASGRGPLIAMLDDSSDGTADKVVRDLPEARGRAHEAVVIAVSGPALRQALRVRASRSPSYGQLAKAVVSTSWVNALQGGAIAFSGTDAGVHLRGEIEYSAFDLPEELFHPVDRRILGALPADATLGVAIHDPGELVAELMVVLQRGGAEFAMADGSRRSEDPPRTLESILDLFAGDVALGTGGRHPKGRVVSVRAAGGVADGRSGEARRGGATLDEVLDAILAGSGRSADVEVGDSGAADDREVRVDVAPAGVERVVDRLDGTPQWRAAWSALDPPSRPAIALWAAPSAAGPTCIAVIPRVSRAMTALAGWVTWDEPDDRMHLRADVLLRPAGSTCPER